MVETEVLGGTALWRRSRTCTTCTRRTKFAHSIIAQTDLPYYGDPVTSAHTRSASSVASLHDAKVEGMLDDVGARSARAVVGDVDHLPPHRPEKVSLFGLDDGKLAALQEKGKTRRSSGNGGQRPPAGLVWLLVYLMQWKAAERPRRGCISPYGWRTPSGLASSSSPPSPNSSRPDPGRRRVAAPPNELG